MKKWDAFVIEIERLGSEEREKERKKERKTDRDPDASGGH